MKAPDDLVPAPGPRRGRDDLVAVAPERGWLLALVRTVLRLLSALTPHPKTARWVDTLVVARLAVLITCASFADTDAGPWLAGVAFYLLAHVSVYEAQSLLESRAEPVDPARALVLAAINVAAVAAAAATVFRWSLDIGLTVALRAGFNVVIFRGAHGLPGNWPDAAVGLGTLASVFLFLGAVRAVVVGARRR
ncbi:MAG: hypothetical protein HYU28_04300 [Actinobacteria bacterium]|nr:hypothetical protein [Actinomycetota bacterium]